MNRLAKRVNKIGSGPFGSLIVVVVQVEVMIMIVDSVITSPSSFAPCSHGCNVSFGAYVLWFGTTSKQEASPQPKQQLL